MIVVRMKYLHNQLNKLPKKLNQQNVINYLINFIRKDIVD